MLGFENSEIVALKHSIESIGRTDQYPEGERFEDGEGREIERDLISGKNHSMALV